MTNNHPLTDEIIEEMLEEKFSEHYDENYVIWIMGGMRAATDWQLEQVIEWLKEHLYLGETITDELKKAMRPQQQENN